VRAYTSATQRAPLVRCAPAHSLAGMHERVGWLELAVVARAGGRDEEGSNRAPTPHYLLSSSSGGRVTVGRAPGNDIVLKSRSVSARHAAFEYGDAATDDGGGGGGALLMRDLGSRNGTFVNDTHLNGHGETVPHSCFVSHGDYIRFGYDLDIYQFYAAGKPQLARLPSAPCPAPTVHLAAEQPLELAPLAPLAPQPEPAPPESEPTPAPAPVRDAATDPPPPEPRLHSGLELDDLRVELEKATGQMSGEIRQHTGGVIEELGRQGDLTRAALRESSGDGRGGGGGGGSEHGGGDGSSVSGSTEPPHQCREQAPCTVDDCGATGGQRTSQVADRAGATSAQGGTTIETHRSQPQL
jgi:hypothetical protein